MLRVVKKILITYVNMFLIKLIVLELSTIIFIPKRSISENVYLFIIQHSSHLNAVFIAKRGFSFKKSKGEAFLVIQWLRTCTFIVRA